MTIRTRVAYTQAKGCRFCLHVGSIALYFGSMPAPRHGARLELFTDRHHFRWSKAGTDTKEVGNG